MKRERLLQYLADAARQLGFTVRTEEGNFQGGLCQKDEERLIFLNRRMSLDERAEFLAEILAAENTDGMYLVPEVRDYIEKFASSESGGVQPDGSAPLT
ncbi:MAG: hypothetical protein PHI18_00980 [bacterium]|nr:hypothetical protein [bacterium]